MGYEYWLRIPAGQRLLAVDIVLRCFEARTTSTAACVERLPGTGSYAFGAEVRRLWPEDFTITVDDKECYVVFHVASPYQQDVLDTLLNCLLGAGVSGMFDEL